MHLTSTLKNVIIGFSVMTVTSIKTVDEIHINLESILNQPPPSHPLPLWQPSIYGFFSDNSFTQSSGNVVKQSFRYFPTSHNITQHNL